MAEFSWQNTDATGRLIALQSQLKGNAPDVANVFTQTFFDGDVIQSYQNGELPLGGALVSVKDLFDVEGFVTRAGTKVFASNPPAPSDAEAVRKIRDAGGIIVGHTNMTELAYSGLGLNPHHGTPRNALLPDCIPGGSTSGGAISVARGLVDIAIGTDTGGSLRIPAAFNGIVGFKPSQSTVSRKGCKPLSRSLDSVGPIARHVADCRQAYKVMRDETVDQKPIDPIFVVPNNFGFEDMDPVIQSHFDRAVKEIKAAGFVVQCQHLKCLDRYKTLPVWQFSAVESRAEFESVFLDKATDLDPRVHVRMSRAEEVDAETYRQTLNMRSSLSDEFENELDAHVLLMPTTPILPPRFSEVESDDAFGRLNLLALRNPSVANVMDACSISLPIGASTTPAGLMLTAGHARDEALLDVAEQLESFCHFW